MPLMVVVGVVCAEAIAPRMGETQSSARNTDLMNLDWLQRTARSVRTDWVVAVMAKVIPFPHMPVYLIEADARAAALGRSRDLHVYFHPR